MTNSVRTAFIIEDDPLFNDSLAAQLRQAGYQPLQYYRGRDAIAASALHPALITLDIYLPDLDGWSVLRAIKRDPFMQQVPVLVVSVYAEDEHGLECGPTAFLRKPFRPAELIEAIERLLLRPDAPARLLLVDDDPFIGELIEAMLPPARFALEQVGSAQQAAQRLSVSLPDMILLDLVMPGVSGFEFLQTRRADPRTRHLPVLALTAKHLSPQEQLDLSQAAQAFIAKKTYTPERFMDKLRRLESVRHLHSTYGVASDQREASAPSVDVSQFRDDFLREARAHLQALRAFLDSREQEGGASLDSATRAAHSLHGGAALMDYPELSQLAEQAEILLYRAAQDKVALDAVVLAQLRALYRGMEQIVSSLSAD